MHFKSKFQRFFYLSVVLPVVVILVSSTAFAAEKHALLIGIDDYSLSPGFQNLRGSAADVAIMKKVLEDKRFGFSRITLLLNERATHSNIEKAFKRLAGKDGDGKVDSVYIYYSGHGSQARDLNGDELQSKDIHTNLIYGYDQTWVTYGARLEETSVAPSGFTAIDHYDILDDEIASWLNDIAARCRQVVFVSDSCHSGSVSRNGILEGVRQGPADRREHPLAKKKYRQMTAKNIISIGASKDSQPAREFIPQGTDEAYGVFTWYWAKALSKCRPEDSWSRLFNRVAQIIEQETPNRQSPQISGAVTMKVFGADFIEPSRTVPVYQVLDKGAEKEVYIGAGLLSGVTEGSVYTLEDKAGQPDAPAVTIVQATPVRSIAKSAANINAYDQLVEVSHQHKFSSMQLLLKAEHAKDRKSVLKEIREVVEDLKLFTITADEKQCDLILYLFRPEQPSLPGIARRHRQPPISNENAALQIWILDSNGFLSQENLRHACTPEGVAALRRNLSRVARVKEFMQIVSPDSPSPLEITVTPMIPLPETGDHDLTKQVPNPSPTKICAFKNYQKLAPMPMPDFLRKQWDLCTMFYFNAKNPTARALYFYVLYIGDQAEIIPVFPSIEDRSEVAEVKPGFETIRGKASIRLDTRTLDHYKLIVCDRPINHHLLFQSEAQSAVSRNAGLDGLNPLESILWNAATGAKNRAARNSGTWHAENITIDMR